jgi:hypothetical protein
VEWEDAAELILGHAQILAGPQIEYPGFAGNAQLF